MDTRRVLLDRLAEGPVSGPALADELGVSRAAVWKAVESLREEGFSVESTADGYVPPSDPPYSAAGIEFRLAAPYTIEFHESIGSTNERARKLAAEGHSDTAVVADEQHGGKGRLGRAWTAPSGGVWVSVLTRPALPTAHAPVLTLAAAVATTDACRDQGVDARIKWPNDVLVPEESEGATNSPVDRGGRKIAGVLTEMEGEADRLSWIAVGIGVNANVDVEELPAGATSLRERLGGDVDRRRFLQHLLERYHDLTADPESVIPAWRERTSTLGTRVRVETPGGVVRGTAVDVEFPGGLIIETAEGRTRVHAGDCEHLRPEE